MLDYAGLEALAAVLREGYSVLLRGLYRGLYRQLGCRLQCVSV